MTNCEQQSVRGTRWLARRVTFAVVALCCSSPAGPAEPRSEDISAELDARRLIGKAYYENDKFADAIEEFQSCIELAPDSAIDHFNLALVLMRAGKYEESLPMLDKARKLDPDLVGVYYMEGIVYKRQGDFEKAISDLKHVADHDRTCMGAYYNLGVCYKFLQRYEDAVNAFKSAVEVSPEHPSSHYQLITLYRRLGKVDDAKRHREIFDLVKDTVDEAEKTAEALERSKYTYIIQAPRLTKDLVPRPKGTNRFVDATTLAGLETGSKPSAPLAPLPEHLNRADYNEAEIRDRYLPLVGGAVSVADYDGDGDLDIYIVNCTSSPQTSGNRLYRNQGGGRYADITESAGVGDNRMGLDAVFGDYDNDGHLDLYVANYGPNVLYHNKGDGTFEEVSKSARVDEPQFGRRALFFDYDHDNDLDIFVGNHLDLELPAELDRFSFPSGLRGELNTLLRNNGNGTFTDQTDEAGLLVGSAQTLDALFADFDADSDIDLLVANANTASRLFINARMGKFTTGGSFSPSIDRRARATAEGDFNKDGKPDLLVAVNKKLYLFANDGRAHFEGKVIPLPKVLTAAGVGRIQVFDHNNDGWSDVLLLSADGGSLAVLAGAGVGRFMDVTEPVGLNASWGRIADMATGDVDGDGDGDIVLQTRDRGPMLLRNDEPKPANWLNVRPVAKKVNRSAFGATVEISSGGHYQRQTVREGPVHFGIGDLKSLDVVRVAWPNGQAQNVIRPSVNDTLTIEQYVKVSASCAFLYSYNGSRFELINEILGIGPLGVPMAPDVYHQPDCTELTKIESNQLVAKDGYYDLRLTEELREITYADRITLRVVDHPVELEVIPNEYFTAPPFPKDRLFAVSDHRPPVSAVDDRGADVLTLIRHKDGRFPTFPRVAQYDGLAQPHTLTLDLGDFSGADKIMLYLDAWIYWPESSVVVAISQDPRFELTPLSLEVRDEQGQWLTALESVGLPTSKGLVVPVDLGGRFLCDDYHVRLSTNMCIYFDRIFVSTHDQAARCRVTELPVAHADLHYRGFSRMTRDSLGFERFDYTDVSPTGSWSPPAGLFTRYGDVTPLLAQADDMYVIFGPGDELSLRFDATSLPELPNGWTRDFVFYANGWVKDGDLNTKFSETVTPLPFHGMSGYPYSASEHYPETHRFQRYLRTYNSRPGTPTIMQLPTADR
ncbi:MAG: VCBS repeat-containing protein [Phycisphaerales bacterium]|nr:MAG: VCBS repeat-containing protein [Phycisphaerales bacterium]